MTPFNPTINLLPRSSWSNAFELDYRLDPIFDASALTVTHTQIHQLCVEAKVFAIRNLSRQNTILRFA
jgi:hypothetical protein